MFEAIEKVLKNTALVTMTVAKEGDNTLRVNLMPAGKDMDDISVPPLTLVGTAAELDEGFADILQHYKEKQTSLAAQMAVFDKEVDESRAEAAKKAEENKAKLKSPPSTPSKGRTAAAGAAKESKASPKEDVTDLF